MAYKRNAIKYNSVGIFLTDSPASKPDTDLLYFFNRVQSASLSVDVTRQDIQHIGSEDFLDRKIVSEGSTTLKMDYLLTDGYEESLLGFNILPSGKSFPTSELWWSENEQGDLVLSENVIRKRLPYEQWFEEKSGNYIPREGVFESNSGPTRYFEKRGAGIIPTDSIKISDPRTAYHELKEDKTILMAIGEEPFDLTGYENRENGYSGIDVLGLGNCYMTDYSISAGVGEFPRASVSFAASNIKHSCYGSGHGGHTWLDSVNELALLLTQLNGFIELENGGNIPLGSSLEKIYKAGVENPSLDLINKGADLTGDTIQRRGEDIILGTGIEFDPVMHKSAVTAISPGGINVYLENLNMGGPILLGKNEGSCIKGSANIQNFNINLPFDRENLYGFESMHVYGRKMKYPQIGTVSFSLLASAFNNGDFRKIFCEDQEYRIEIDMNNHCDYFCSPSSEHETFLKFIINNAKFDSYNFNESIGSIATVDCNFSFGVSTNNGMFMSGSFVDGYLLRDQDGFVLSEQGNRIPI